MPQTKHDIFLSYSSKDTNRVKPIVALLEAQGWQVWWDPAKKACPDGWHLPTDGDWKKMIQSFGGYRDYQNEWKEIGDPKKSYQVLIKGGESNFAALLGGFRNSNGEFLNLSKIGYY